MALRAGLGDNLIGRLYFCSVSSFNYSFFSSASFSLRPKLIVKYNIGLKTLLQQGISEPIFYGDLVYKFKRIVEKPNFSDQF